MDVQHYQFETFPGLPPHGEPGVFMIEHEQFGWMEARWRRSVDAFFGIGFFRVGEGEFVPQMVIFREEQVPKALCWARLPLTREEVAALT